MTGKQLQLQNKRRGRETQGKRKEAIKKKPKYRQNKRKKIGVRAKGGEELHETQTQRSKEGGEDTGRNYRREEKKDIYNLLGWRCVEVMTRVAGRGRGGWRSVHIKNRKQYNGFRGTLISGKTLCFVLK